ncbi:MAG: TlpA family protein disulfide reductase [Planctomycetota bacterium]|nr:MAG: TlpA family protein disulfide reductase [Planctomycetota bacterium]
MLVVAAWAMGHSSPPTLFLTATIMNTPAFSEQDELEPRPDRRWGWYFLVGLGAAMLGGLMFLAWLGTPRSSTWAGKPLPELDLQPLLGTDRPLGKADLQGKVAVLHFWGTWCPPCRLEFPEFVAEFAPLSDHGDLMVVSVSCSPGPEYDLDELREKTQEFLAPYQFPYPTYCDPTAMTRQQLALIAPGGSFGYPTTLIVDRQGTIVHAITGYREGEMHRLAQRVEAMLD